MNAGRIVLWDVMDTLVRDPFTEVMPAFFGMNFKDLLRSKSPTAWLEFERGETDEATYFARAFSDGRDFDGPAFREAMIAGYAWLPGMQALLARLAEDRQTPRVEMHALSNYPVWYERLEARLGLSRYLSWQFVSCRTGVRKPSPAAYLGAAAACGVPPEACLFIDDRAENVEAARAVGMDAFRFVDAAQTAAALTERDLLHRAGP